MPFFLKLATALMPKIATPPALKGLEPSWSGIFRRVLSPPRVVTDSEFGTRTIVILSRDEYKRLADFNYREALSKCPGTHMDVVILEDFSSKEMANKVHKMMQEKPIIGPKKL